DGTIRFWNLQTRAEIAKIDGTKPEVRRILGQKGVTQMLWLPGDQGLVTASPKGELHLWDPATGKPRGLLGQAVDKDYKPAQDTEEVGKPRASAARPISDMTCSSDGKFLVTAMVVVDEPWYNVRPLYRNVQVWDVAGRKLSHEVRSFTAFDHLAAAPDGA